MTKIRTAEEILADKMQDQYDTEYWEDFKYNNPNMYSVILKSFQEYAKQFIEIAVNESFQRCDDAIDQYVVEYFDSTYEQREETINFEKSDTILKLKERVV